MKKLLVVLAIVMAGVCNAQSNEWTTALDVSLKVSGINSIAPTLTVTEDFNKFRVGIDYSKSLSTSSQYRYNTLQGIVGYNLSSLCIEANSGLRFKDGYSRFVWGVGVRKRFDNKIMLTAKIGSDYVSASIGFTPFKF